MRSLKLHVLLTLGLPAALVLGCGGSSGKPADASRDVASDAGDARTDIAADTSTDVAADAAADVATDLAGDAADVGIDATLDASDAPVTVATLFLSHAVNNTIYRLAVTPGKDPVLDAMIPAPAVEGLAMSPKGELFAASEDGSVLRFTTPLATPTANGKLQALGVTDPEQLTFVDDELWIPTTDYNSCTTTASKITRVAFDATGAGSVAGMVQAAGIVTAARGIMWDPLARTLFVSDCDTVNTIQPYHVSADHMLTALAGSTGGSIHNPHGMAVSSWGELFVSNALANEVLRFTIDAQGTLTPNGSITGNGLNTPVGLGFAPWGELFVVDQGSGALSRFTFASGAADGGVADAAEAGDAGDTGAPAHAAVANGTFQTGLDSTANSHDLGWMLLVPGASTPPADGGVDAAVDSASGG